MRDEKFLLSLRPGGEWDFPGGRIDDQEVYEAAIREHQEETGAGLVGPPLPLFVCTSSWKGQPRLQVFIYWPSFDGEHANLEPDKCERLEWISPETALTLNCAEHARKFLEWVANGPYPEVLK